MSSPIGSKRTVKIFVLYLLENINYPLEYCTINDIVMQTDYVMFLDFAESFNEMVDGELIESFEQDGLTYYQVSDKGRIVAQAFKLLYRAKCSSPFFFEVGEKHYANQPSSEVAMALAQGFQDNKNFDKANQYLREALAVEQDAAAREKLYVRIGILDMSINNFAAAVEAFRSAQEINPENAHAPFFLAQCYVNGAKGCSGLAKDAIYWVAYDLIQKALPLLEAQDADRVEAANQLANAYRGAFPTKEECFFNELADGSTYVVNCGFAQGVATRVRPRVQ